MTINCYKTSVLIQFENAEVHLKPVINKNNYRSLLSRIESQRFFVRTNLCEECKVSEITLVGGAQRRAIVGTSPSIRHIPPSTAGTLSIFGRYIARDLQILQLYNLLFCP